jgi:hypothetical protein
MKSLELCKSKRVYPHINSYSKPDRHERKMYHCINLGSGRGSDPLDPPRKTNAVHIIKLLKLKQVL